MNCFPCFQSQKSSKSNSKRELESPSRQIVASTTPETKKQKPGDETKQVENGNIAAQSFTFRELATATKNFRQECLLGEGGFGRVYKGTLASNGQVVAVKQLDRNGLQGNKEFLVEVLMLSLLHHPNLVNLIGYCADGDQRLLVYELMPGGSVEDHLVDITPEQKPLDWFTRMRIAFGTAKGLEYLHHAANPPVIYRDLKPSNILLDKDFTPKLSDFGLAKLGPSGERMPVSSRVMGTYGYCAPEYARSGQLTLKSDVYSFGVILLELITGRRALDTTRPIDEQNLVSWAQPIFRDPKKFPDMADPLLNKQFPEKDLNQAVAIAAMCLQEESVARPLMSDVVTALSFLSMDKAETIPSTLPPPTPPSDEKVDNHAEQKNKAEDSSDNGDKCNESDQDKDSSDHQDKEGDNHEYQDGEKERYGDSSDHEDDDWSDYEDGDDAVHEDSEDGHQQNVTESKKRGKSSMKSVDRSVSSRCRSSKRSEDRRVSLRCKSNNRSDDGSVASSDENRRGSHNYNDLIRHKSSKNSLSSDKSSIESLSSLGHKSSKKSQDGSDSVHSSRESHDGSVSSVHSSSRELQDASVHFDHTNSRGSEDGSTYSS